MKKVAFKTFGCRLNQAETAVMQAQFKAAGYDVAEDFREDADVYVLHTCTITGHAEKTAVQQARSVKRKHPEAIIILAGCAVEVNRDELAERTGADYLFRQDEKFMMPQILDGVELCNCHTESVVPLFNSTRASVKVQDGCNFFCSYCIVPYTRGRPRSRSFSEIVDEVKAFADRGYKEIVLTGANIGCYDDDGKRLVNVLEAIEDIDLVKRIRISSIEVSTTERQVIDFMADSDKLCNYLHFPLQSGDNEVLKAMRRRYTREEYIDMVEYALSKIPMVGLGADIITGLPGEDKKAFFQTYDLINSFPFSNLHVFPYSIRKGTVAADMPDQVPKNIAKERTLKLIELGDEKRRKYAESWINSSEYTEILVEKVDETGNGYGWTSEYCNAKIIGGMKFPLSENMIVKGRISDFIDEKFVIDNCGSL